MARREYKLSITVNGNRINKVIIDSHYEMKHASNISDKIILDLVKTLDGERHEPDEVDPPYVYFVKDGIQHLGKRYKLIWLLEDHQIYIGVVNAYRR